MRVLVTGATGFVGGYLCELLESKCYEIVRATGDLRHLGTWQGQFRGVDQVYALAANMGGRQFISRNPALILADNVRLSLCTVEAARSVGARLLFVSSACVYPERGGSGAPLRESDAYPASPDEYYGWSKLFGELIANSYSNGKIVRLDSVYGKGEKWRGGREKVIPATCRKVAEAKLNGYDRIPIMGDGKQRRAFLHARDAARVLHALMWAEFRGEVNAGGAREISVNELVGLVSEAAGCVVKPVPTDGPTGSRQRSLDLGRLKELAPGWKETKTLEEGIGEEYLWIERLVRL